MDVKKKVFHLWDFPCGISFVIIVNTILDLIVNQMFESVRRQVGLYQNELNTQWSGI